MKLNHGLHLAYCTNIHRGETWEETLDALKRYTLPVRDRVSPSQPYAIGLRLSQRAAIELSDRSTLVEFQRWLGQNHCYVFTINGFPYGRFHGTRVKEQVYLPDWTSPDRVAFTNRLFDILAELLPPGLEGSVSTVPCSFKEFIRTDEQVVVMGKNLWSCVDHISALTERTGKAFHLGLEPEPLCYLETSEETVRFFERLLEIQDLRFSHGSKPVLDGISLTVRKGQSVGIVGLAVYKMMTTGGSPGGQSDREASNQLKNDIRKLGNLDRDQRIAKIRDLLERLRSRGWTFIQQEGAEGEWFVGAKNEAILVDENGSVWSGKVEGLSFTSDPVLLLR